MKYKIFMCSLLLVASVANDKITLKESITSIIHNKNCPLYLATSFLMNDNKDERGYWVVHKLQSNNNKQCIYTHLKNIDFKDSATRILIKNAISRGIVF